MDSCKGIELKLISLSYKKDLLRKEEFEVPLSRASVPFLPRPLSYISYASRNG
jgi:hypothetical protein